MIIFSEELILWRILVSPKIARLHITKRMRMLGIILINLMISGGIVIINLFSGSLYHLCLEVGISPNDQDQLPAGAPAEAGRLQSPRTALPSFKPDRTATRAVL